MADISYICRRYSSDIRLVSTKRFISILTHSLMIYGYHAGIDRNSIIHDKYFVLQCKTQNENVKKKNHEYHITD